MHSLYRYLTAPVLVAGLVVVLSAQEPPLEQGRVLLLRSERALEGDIEKAGDQYRIRRGTAESWVAADQVVRLFAGWDEACRYMQARANLGDPDERVRLARWCQLNGQDARALAEARTALQFRPDHVEAKRLVALLQRRPDSTTTTASAQPAVVPLGPAPDVDLSPESMVAFKTRVQPILMNACVHCHSGNQAGRFRLYRITEGGQQDSTRRNLAVVLGHVNLEQVAVSPLLVKAFSPHGGAKQWPIKNREAPVFQMLQTWIEQVAETNPHLRTVRAPGSRFAQSTSPIQQTGAIAPSAARPMEPVEAKDSQPAPFAAPAQTPTAMRTTAPVEDEFSPQLFNDKTAQPK
jgi:hypothetical protein